MAVTYATPVTNQGFNTSATSRTISVTVPAGANGMVLLFAAENTGETVTSATYNSVSLTKKDSQAGSSFGNAEIWELKNPTVGTANLVVNHVSAFHVIIGCVVLTGCDVSGASFLRTCAKTTATTGTTQSVTVSGVLTGELVMGVLQLDGTSHSVVAGTNETVEYDTISAAGANESAGLTQLGANGGVVSPSWTTSTHNVLIATSALAAAATVPSGDDLLFNELEGPGGAIGGPNAFIEGPFIFPANVDAAITHVIGDLTLNVTTNPPTVQMPPTIGDLVLGGVAPTQTITVPPTIGVLTLGGVAPTFSETLTATIGELILGATAPTLSTGVVINHVIGELLLQGGTHSVSFDSNVAHVIGNLILGASTHSVSTGSSVDLSPSIGELVLSGVAPAIGETLPVQVGILSLSGVAPTLNESFNVQIGVLVLGAGTHQVTGSTAATTRMVAGFIPPILWLMKKRGPLA